MNHLSKNTEMYVLRVGERHVVLALASGRKAALNDTIRVAGSMVAVAGSIKSHTGTIATVLSQRAAQGRQS